MSARPGRNDPCHCGSGKKYKKCHLPIDEQERGSSGVYAPVKTLAAPLVTGVDEISEGPADWGETSGKAGGLSHIFKLASRSGLLKRDPELRRLFEKNQALLNYLDHQEEIEASSARLKERLFEFETLCQDPAAYEARTGAIFAEAAFIPFRFTPEDLRRAFAEVGVPALDDTSKRTGKLLRKALLFLANKERRTDFALRLSLLVLEYERRGRHLDALIIRFCARMTAEDTDDSNPFLGRMFLYGLDAWHVEQNAARDAVLQEAGFDLGRNVGFEEAEQWIETQMADPEAKARVQRVLDAHPEFQSTAADTYQVMARKAVELLDREDSARLLLGADELLLWSSFLMEKLQAMEAEIGLPEPGAKVSKAQKNKAFEQFYLPAIREITKGIFTPERIRRLVAGLQEYRQALEDAGDKTTALRATTTILYVKREEKPEENAFLVNLCARSLTRFGDSLSQEAP